MNGNDNDDDGEKYGSSKYDHNKLKKILSDARDELLN
jgi:hypothetical protein